VTPLHVEHHGAIDGAREAWRNPAGDGRDRRRLPERDRLHQRAELETRERAPAGEHLEHDDARGVDVGACVELADSAELLGARGTGVCVADGRRTVLLGGSERIDTYCSASCESATCPEAWECVDNVVQSDTAPRKVCVKQAAVCGDGVKQLDEACEDGNTSGKDGCSADCKKVLPAGIDVRSMSGYVLDKGEHGDPLSKSFYITHFPKFDDGTKTFGEGNVEKVTSDRLTLKLGVIDAVTYQGYRLTAVIPRTVGKVDSVSGFEGSWRGPVVTPTKPVELEVVSATSDGRAYEVRAHIEGHLPALDLPAGVTDTFANAIVVIDATFVVTVP
jgi:cysteine-rich repeat protein